jgi:hypothetical protein
MRRRSMLADLLLKCAGIAVSILGLVSARRL